MLGKKSGVLALIKEQQPSLIGIHCSAVDLNCVTKMPKKVPMAEKVYSLYYISCIETVPQQNQLEECIQVSEHIKLPTRAGGTRWVPPY